MPGKIFCSGNPSGFALLVPSVWLALEDGNSPLARCGESAFGADEAVEGFDVTWSMSRGLLILPVGAGTGPSFEETGRIVQSMPTATFQRTPAVRVKRNLLGFTLACLAVCNSPGAKPLISSAPAPSEESRSML